MAVFFADSSAKKNDKVIPAVLSVKSGSAYYGLTGRSSSPSEAITPITPATTIRAKIQAQLPPKPSESATGEAARTSAGAGAAAAAVDPNTMPADARATSALRVTI